MHYGSKSLNSFVDRNAERFQIKLDKDWSFRECRMYILKMILDGTIYDNLQPWHNEYQGSGASGKYIPLSQRRPSIIYRLPLIIVNESVAMLFGDEHFPTFRSENEALNEFIEYIDKHCGMQEYMMRAAYIGSLGSVCVIVKVLNGKFHLDILDTYCLTPEFDPLNPQQLIRLTERRKYDGGTLRSYGYGISNDDVREMFFLIREWDDNSELYYIPFKCEEAEGHIPVVDMERSTLHYLGFVPAIWTKNSATIHCDVDGMCTFEGAIDTFFEIDYHLSQLGRLLKYNSDPALVIKNPSSLEGNQLIKGVGVLNLDEKGDAYLLEMTNQSTTAVIDYVRCLREFSLEVLRGNRANPDKLSSIHSGRALQMLNASLISLVGEMRVCYGDGLLLPIYKMMIDIIQTGQFELALDMLPPENIDLTDMKLDWPKWYVQTPQDDLQEAQTLQTLTSSGIMSTETAVNTIADQYKIMDVQKEMKMIDQSMEKMQKFTSKLESPAKKPGGNQKDK